MRIIATIICAVWAAAAWAQPGPVLHYSFEDCELADATALVDDLSVVGSVGCNCGAADSALVVGSSDTLVFPDEAKDYLVDDYSISFYFKPSNAEPFVDLLSIRRQCDQDSVLSLKYFANTHEVELLMAQNNTDKLRAKGPLREALCWHHVVVVKSELIVSLYLDDVFIDNFNLPYGISYSDAAHLGVGTSACLGISEDKFLGLIDEVKIFDRALSASEIHAAYHHPDQIIDRDTTIFLGDTISLTTGTTCAQTIQWSPTAEMDLNDIRHPRVFPSTTTTYEVDFKQNDCDVRDQMTVYVIDLDNVDCSALLLPNAFTPNNDGLNDQFGISNTFIIDEVESFEIFDRWGGKVFETMDKNGRWDGTFDGAITNPGMYLYKVRYTCQGEEFLDVGNFSLLR